MIVYNERQQGLEICNESLQRNDQRRTAYPEGRA